MSRGANIRYYRDGKAILTKWEFLTDEERKDLYEELFLLDEHNKQYIRLSYLDKCISENLSAYLLHPCLNIRQRAEKLVKCG
jgi:hypothetical protein